MFQGAAALNLDNKGRLAIPSRHRDALTAAANGGLVLTAHPHHCLLVFPVDAWEKFRATLLSTPTLEARSATFRRLFVGHARDETLDAAGRVLVAPELREWAGLEKQVWLVGVGPYFELWSDAGWKEQQAHMNTVGDEPLPPGFEDLVL